MSRYAAACLLLLAVAAPVFADESKPWSQVVLGEPKASDPRQEPLMMIAIDGKRDFNPETYYVLAPGRHEISVAITREDTAGMLVVQTLAIDMQPCTNYELIGRRTPGTSNDNHHWTPELRAQTPIKRCVKKFKAALAPTAP